MELTTKKSTSGYSLIIEGNARIVSSNPYAEEESQK
jgi:hypothetical protein